MMRTRKRKRKRHSSLSTEVYFFDKPAANRAERFYAETLVHVKGEWASRPLKLLPWERDRVIRPLFGWKRRADETRRYRTAFVFVPQKTASRRSAPASR